MKVFSKEEKQNYKQGIDTGREDFVWCSGNNKKIKECLKNREKMKDLCIQRKDKNGVSFCNGYIKFFNDKLKNTK